MAVYDLWAVLASTGPLALLLKVMQRRNEPLTALVYESRPANMANYGRPGQGVVGRGGGGMGHSFGWSLFVCSLAGL